MKPNWGEIKAEYLNGVSRKELCEKYNVSYVALDHHIKDGKWNYEKAENGRKTAEKLSESIQDRILSIRNQRAEDCLNDIQLINGLIQSTNDSPLKINCIDKKHKVWESLFKAYGIAEKKEVISNQTINLKTDSYSEEEKSLINHCIKNKSTWEEIESIINEFRGTNQRDKERKE